MQAAWLIAWKRLSNVRDEAHLRPWLVSVAANEAKRVLRKRRRRREVEVTIDATGEPGGVDPATGISTMDLNAAIEPTEDSSAIGATDGPAVESDTGPEFAAALVTGTETCTGGEVETTEMEGYTLLHATGPEGHCTVTASDPRVSGPSSEGDMWDACFLMGPDDPPFYPSGCYWGDYGIDGPDGSWVGTWTGVDDPALGKASYLILLEGTGAYEGWSFVAHWLDPFTGAPLTFSGLIYEGALPPWEPPVE